jgi:integrase
MTDGKARRLVGSKTEIIPNEKYRLEVSAGYDVATGKRRRPSEVFYGTGRDAEIRLNQMCAETGRHGSASMTLWEFIETMYLPAIAPPELRKRTVDEYRKKLERYVKPSPIANAHLDKLDRYAMVSWMRGIKTQIANKQTQLHVYSALSAALGKAVMWGYLDENMLRKAVEPPSPDEFIPAVLTEDEANDYLDAFAGHELEPIVVLGIAAGLRPSESYGMQWSDVDFAGGVIAVRRGLHQRDGEVWEEDAKNRESKRAVTMPEWAMDALARHRGAGRICGALTPNQIAGRYRKHASNAGLTPWCPIENLRHTSATIALERGESEADVAPRLGHSSPKMLRERYAKRRLLRDARVAGVMQEFRRVHQDVPSATSAPSCANANA